MAEGGAGGYFEVCSIKSSATGVFDSYQVTRLDVKQKGRAAMYSFAHESVTGAGWTRVLQQRQVRPLYGSGGVMKVKTRFMMHVFVGLAFALGASVSAPAQDREQYVISAKAGGVNLVSGDVTLKRRGEIQWQSLTSQVDLGSGDIVRTGATGRVEMLLNPGSYLRAAENSEFELTNASLDVLQVKLLRGSVIVEVAGADEARTFIEVTMPQTKVAIDRKGLYRMNLVQEGTEVLVRKGRATVSAYASLTTELKDGRKILVSGGVPVVTKFDKKEQDTFDLWSQQRAETLVASNRRLPNSAIARSYASYSNSGFGLRRGYRSSGLWIYDPFFRGRTFLPFYYGWSSPYGRSYSTGFGFPAHRQSLFGFGSSVRHSSRHGSDHVSNRPHSGGVHHQSPAHRSSPHHGGRH